MNDSGQRFFAALLGVPVAAAPTLALAGMAPEWLAAYPVILEALFFLSIPMGFTIGWRLGPVRGSGGWKRFGLLGAVLFGAMFGHVMEGAEGALWGGLAGVAVGFAYGLYAPWIAYRLPARWGVKAAWGGLGILFYLVPTLAAIRLFFGKFDGDDLIFEMLAVFLGIQHATRKGWLNKGEIVPGEIRAAVAGYVRLWLNPRLMIWALAFLVPGLAVGGFQNLYRELPGEPFRIVLDPHSWWWPLSLLAAALAGTLLTFRKRDTAGRLYLSVCLLVAVACLFTLTGYLRFRTVITDGSIEIRRGVFQSFTIPRDDLAHIETEVDEGRRHLIRYPVLVTRDGTRHSLLHHTHSAEIRDHLRDNWGVAVTPP